MRIDADALRREALSPDSRFRSYFADSGSVCTYVFLDHGIPHEKGEASSLTVVWLLFDEFKRGRLSVHQDHQLAYPGSLPGQRETR
jgi:hypothetical protein